MNPKVTKIQTSGPGMRQPTAQCPIKVTVTEEGKRLMAEAPLHECESEHTPDGNGAYCRWCGETVE